MSYYPTHSMFDDIEGVSLGGAALPSNQTQQAINNFSVRRNPRVVDFDPDTGTSVVRPIVPGIESRRVTQELQGGNEVFPTMAWGTMENSPAKIEEYKQLSMEKPGQVLSGLLGEREALRQQYRTAPPEQRRLIARAGQTLNQKIDRSIGLNVDNLRFNAAYTGFKPGSGFVDQDGNEIVKAGPSNASRLLGLSPTQMLNLKEPGIDLATRVYDYRSQNPGVGLAQIPLNVFDPAADPNIGSQLARENRAAVSLRRRSPSLYSNEEYYQLNPQRTNYAPSIDYQGAKIQTGQHLDDVMADVYQLQKDDRGIRDLYDEPGYVSDRKFTAGRPMSYTLSEPGQRGTFNQLVQKAEKDFGKAYDEQIIKLDRGNRDTPLSDNMIAYDRNRQELIGDYEGLRIGQPQAGEYLNSSRIAGENLVPKYGSAPVVTRGNETYRALSQTPVARPGFTTRSNVIVDPLAQGPTDSSYNAYQGSNRIRTYQPDPQTTVVDFSGYGAVPEPYGARAKTNYIPDMGGGGIYNPEGNTTVGMQSMLNSSEPVIKPGVQRVESRVPRITEYVREVVPLATPATLAFNRPPEVERPNPLSQAERAGLMEFTNEAAKDYSRGLGAMRRQYEIAPDRSGLVMTGDEAILGRAENLAADALDRGILGARTLRGQDFDPASELQPLAQKLNLQGQGWEKADQGLTDALSYKMAVDPSEGRNYSMLEPVQPLTELMEPDSLRMQAQAVDEANLTRQANAMGRGFSAADELQADPRVQALKEKAIARQQEIDAGNELMAIRQQRQAERLAPAKVAVSPFAQRQQLVVNDARLDSAIANLQARTNPRSKLGEVLSRVVGAGMMIR